jgi:outer membrane protein TolC
MTMLTTLFQVLLRNVPRSAVRIGAAVLIMAVAGCTVGPDFEAPKSPSLTRYTSPGEATVPGPDATKPAPAQAIALGARVAANWWTLFRSSKLDLLVKQAIAGNLTLESAKARLAEAREAIAVATSALYPQIGLNAGITEQKQSADAFGLTPDVAPLPSSFNLFQVGPTASYTPDLFGQTHRRIEQQVALAEYQSDQLDVAYLTLTGNTVSHYLGLAESAELRQAAADALAQGVPVGSGGSRLLRGNHPEHEPRLPAISAPRPHCILVAAMLPISPSSRRFLKPAISSSTMN